MKKLNNPFEALPGYNCFGCSSSNSQGLRMRFYENGEEIISTWNPDVHFQGYINVIHGGIQSTLMDEIASWVVFIKLKTGGVTSRLNVRFRKPLLVNEGPVTLKAKLKSSSSRIAEIEVKLFNKNEILCADGVAEYFILSPEKAKERMNFPEMEKFYE